MKKISTLFKKDPQNLGRVINTIAVENEWVIQESVLVTQKFDGTSTAIIDGKLYKRFDAKKGRKIPYGAIPCQEADDITGHHPHWIACDRNKKEDQYFFEAFDRLTEKIDGTYELCGPKVQGNPENLSKHYLLKHGSKLVKVPGFDFETLKNFLSDPEIDMEGLVFHHPIDQRMCKLRKSDFGVKRREKVRMD